MAVIDTDILIVGGGVAGPALAAALAGSGMSVTLIERSAAPLDTARGDHLQPRSVEILDAWGALPEFLERGAERRDGTDWFDDKGNVLLRAPVTDLDISHPYFLYLNHEDISYALLAAAAKSPGFTLLKPIRDWSVIEQSPDALQIRVNESEGLLHEINCRVLVGADGRNSAVRKLAGIAARTPRYEQPINVLFGKFDEVPDGNNLSVYVGDNGILAAIPRTGGQCKIGVASSPKAIGEWRNASELTLLEKVRSYAKDLTLHSLHYEGVYPPVRVETDCWVTDNIVLLGDACHAMHPARSQGMNLTIRCADVLAAMLIEAGESRNPALAAYERTTKPGIDAILAGNHRAGESFDSTDPEHFKAFSESLKAIAANPDALRSYAMRSAGYGG